MKEWAEWELELLNTYKQQGTTSKVIAQLLSCSIEDVEEKLGDI